MYKSIIKKIPFLIYLLLPMVGFCQNNEVEMADAMRTEGKIYVVVLVILTLFIGLFGYLVSADRRLKKLEEELRNK